ncbi:FUSC family protein [Pseudooceanicola sp. CBS1P-1]|uniref:FUSC family protein n=1 Tax=Pseudooceanicola albus TaxID=2692189 RepID=A0A6L7G8D3_9RHOB|nr:MULTISPECIES: FUSC family protein [Pseudooceanicola]MBT9385979.1 FUSC family protein [Pseudooceanicola endophyticus]MXN19600.1 FUSC family protein [Pseudooceanicola albus]
MTSVLERLGFDPGKLAFAGRTAIAACLALLLAWALGLHHPQWAAMSVWAASQPLRGQLLEKSLFRILGTLAGAAVGILLVQAYRVEPLLMVAGLALWVALCTATTNLLRGFVAYGAVLAGYSAAMVSLIDIGQPDHVLAIGADRVATVLTGVVVATLVGLLLAGRINPAAGLRADIRTLVADILTQLGVPGGASGTPRAALLERIAAIEEGLDPHAAGSLRSRQQVRSLRAVLISAVALLMQTGRPPASPNLSAAARALRNGQLDTAISHLDAVNLADPDQAAALSDLRDALARLETTEAAPTTRPEPPVVLHRDWLGAREAGLRALTALLLVGVFWQVSGWSSGNLMLLGLSVMISLFSTFESPVRMMRWVGIGQTTGVLGMLACRWLLWPHAGAEVQLILMMMPFVLLGAFVMAHHRTVPIAFDYNMVFLLTLQPHFPLTGSFGQSVMAGVGVVMAPMFAWVMYRFMFHARPERRAETLVRMTRQDLAAFAADPRALDNGRVWQARLYHRVLRLIRTSLRTGQGSEAAIRHGLDALRVWNAVRQLHAVLADPALPARERDTFTQALKRIERIEADPAPALDSVTQLSPRLQAR